LLNLQNDLQVLLKELGGEDGIQQAVGVFSITVIVAADDAAACDHLCCPADCDDHDDHDGDDGDDGHHGGCRCDDDHLWQKSMMDNGRNNRHVTFKRVGSNNCI